MKSSQEVENARNNVDTDTGSKYPGMSYEEGVADALDWVLGYNDEFEYSEEG